MEHPEPLSGNAGKGLGHRNESRIQATAIDEPFGPISSLDNVGKGVVKGANTTVEVTGSELVKDVPISVPLHTRESVASGNVIAL